MPNSRHISEALTARLAQLQLIYHQQPELARAECEALIAQAREQHATLLQIYAAELYGKIMDHAGEALTARNLLYEALQQAQAIHNFKLEARVCEQIARSYYTAGEYSPALQNWLHCIELSEFEEGEAAVWMLAKIGVGQVYDALGENRTALLFHHKALARIDEVNDPYLHAKILINIGVVQLKLNQLSEAKAALNAAQAICLQHDYADYAATTYSRLAEIALKEDDLAPAMDLLTHALRYAQSVKYRWGEANILHNMAQIHTRQQHYSAALTCIFQAQTIAREHQFKPVLLRLHQAAAHNAEQSGQIKLAVDELKASIALQSQLQHAQQIEHNQLALQKTEVRASSSVRLVNLLNHHEIENGSQASYWPLIANEGRDLLRVSHVSVWLLDAAHKQFNCLHINPPASCPLPALRQAQMPVFFSSLPLNQPLIAHDVAHHHYTWDLAQCYLLSRQTASVMVFPIQHHGQRFMLMFEHGPTQRNWLPEEIDLAHQISHIGARALSNEDRHHYLDEIHLLNAQLSQSHQELEQHVQERTEVLSQSNQELELTMNKLVQSEKMAALGRLVAGIANELIPPLINALEDSHVLSRHSLQVAKQLENGELKRSALVTYLSTITQQSKRIEQQIADASELVNQFKLVAVDTSSERRRRFNLQHTVTELSGVLASQVRHLPHQIKIDIPAELELDSFPGPLEQVLTHLIQNALQHGFSKQTAGLIEISAQQDGEQLELRCRDNGIGMAAEQLAHALEPFYSGHATEQHNGLGLYIANNILTKVLAGSLSIESQLGQYTLVKLRFPITAPTPSV